MNFLRQGGFGIPRSRANGMNVLVRRTRLERAHEGVATESGVQRGLGEKLSALIEVGLVGNSVLG
jgi:hypothetical protein